MPDKIGILSREATESFKSGSYKINHLHGGKSLPEKMYENIPINADLLYRAVERYMLWAWACDNKNEPMKRQLRAMFKDIFIPSKRSVDLVGVSFSDLKRTIRLHL